MQLLVLIYLIFLFRSIVIGDWMYKIIMLVVGVIFALTVFIIRKIKIKNAKKKVEQFEKNPDLKIEPFVNVNRDDWYVIQELPVLTRVQAKKVVWMRKHNGWYTSLDDFFNKNAIYDQNHKDLLSKMIKIK